jgi:hypothetical protein
VPLDDARRVTLVTSDAEAQQRIFDVLVRDRAWPS